MELYLYLFFFKCIYIYFHDEIQTRCLRYKQQEEKYYFNNIHLEEEEGRIGPRDDEVEQSKLDWAQGQGRQGLLTLHHREGQHSQGESRGAAEQEVRDHEEMHPQGQIDALQLPEDVPED